MPARTGSGKRRTARRAPQPARPASAPSPAPAPPASQPEAVPGVQGTLLPAPSAVAAGLPSAVGLTGSLTALQTALPMVLESLRLLGFQTIEQVLGAASVAGPELSAALGGVNPDALVASLPTAGVQSVSASEMEVIENATYALGVDLDSIPRLTTAPDLPPPPLALAGAGPAALAAGAPAAAAEAAGGAVAAPPSPAVNLVGNLPPIRNQEKRGTCVAFSALAAYEHYLNTQGAPHTFSEQFLYWDCKANDGHPTSEGTWLGVAFPLLHRDGCCLEDKWPYNPNPIPGNEGQGPPIAGAQLQALAYRLAALRTLSPTAVADIKTTLAGGRCVAVSIPVYNSWYRSTWVAKTGDITNPLPGEARVGGHAICLCGYVEMPTAPGLGGGRFLLRNSWGQNWGLTSPYGKGYGTIPFSYLARLGTEAYAVG